MCFTTCRQVPPMQDVRRAIALKPRPPVDRYPALVFVAAWDRQAGQEIRSGLEQTELVSTVDFLNRSGLQLFEAFGGMRGLKATFCEGGNLFRSESGPQWFWLRHMHKLWIHDGERAIGEGRQNLPPGFESHSPLWSHRPNHRAGMPRTWLQCSGTGPWVQKPTPTSFRLEATLYSRVTSSPVIPSGSRERSRHACVSPALQFSKWTRGRSP